MDGCSRITGPVVEGLTGGSQLGKFRAYSASVPLLFGRLRWLFPNSFERSRGAERSSYRTLASPCFGYSILGFLVARNPFRFQPLTYER